MPKSIFASAEFKPYKTPWDARVKELVARASYYDGSVYTQQQQSILWTMGPRIAKEIKPLFLPLSRAVDIDAGIIPAGWAFPPEDPKFEAWSKARDTLFDMSAWDVNGVLFVHYGAMYGVSGLRVADVRESKLVIIQPIRPINFMLVSSAQYKQAPDMALYVETRQDNAGDEFEYAEVITDALIRTFKNGEKFGYDGREPEYTNEQGVIPIIECVHIADGTALGECTFQKSIPMLNELNEMASRLSEVIRKNADPQFVTSGAEPSELQRGSDYMWFIPENAAVNAIVPKVDIAGVLEFIREIKDGVNSSLPELSFDDIRKASQIAAETIELQLVDLVIKIKRTRPNYDRALVMAMMLAGAAGIEMGIEELKPLADTELILDPDRAIIPASPKQLIELEMMQIELDNMKNAGNNGEGAV
jgi:hypothetical protein